MIYGLIDFDEIKCSSNITYDHLLLSSYPLRFVFEYDVSSDDSSGHLFGEPLLGIFSSNSLMLSEFSLSVLSSSDSLSSSAENNVEVHSENTCVGIILDSKINMLIDTKSEVTYV